LEVGVAEHDIDRRSRELQEARSNGEYDGRGVEYRQAENAILRDARDLVAGGKGPDPNATPTARAAHVENLERQIAVNDAAIGQATQGGSSK
jgi:hypothetical protein